MNDPVLDLGLLHERYFAVANVAAVLFTFAFFGVFLTNVRFFIRVWDYTATGAGMAITPIPLAAGITGMLSGRILGRLGMRKGAFVAAILFSGGLAAMTVLTGNEADYWRDAFVPLVATGIGVGLAITVLNSSAMIHLPPERYSMGSAIISTGRQIGAAIGVAVSLALFAATAHGADPLGVSHLSWLVFASTGLIAGVGITIFYRPPVRVA